MNHRQTMRVAFAALGAGCVVGAMAQSSAPITDAGPPPAESRDSAGAIVIDRTPPRAPTSAATDPAAATRVMGSAPSVTRDVHPGPTRQRLREIVRQERNAEQRELRLRGASSLISR